MSTESSTDPMEFLKNMWSSMGVPIPGMVTPTLDTNELDKRIAELKTVEGWLKTNLGMLQMTVQGLEMQRATLAAMQAMSQSAGGSDANANPNPFANPTLWPWNFMQGADKTATDAADAAGSPATPEQTPPKSGGKTK